MSSSRCLFTILMIVSRTVSTPKCLLTIRKYPENFFSFFWSFGPSNFSCCMTRMYRCIDSFVLFLFIITRYSVIFIWIAKQLSLNCSIWSRYPRLHLIAKSTLEFSDYFFETSPTKLTNPISAARRLPCLCSQSFLWILNSLKLSAVLPLGSLYRILNPS